MPKNKDNKRCVVCGFKEYPLNKYGFCPRCWSIYKNQKEYQYLIRDKDKESV